MQESVIIEQLRDELFLVDKNLFDDKLDLSNLKKIDFIYW